MNAAPIIAAIDAAGLGFRTVEGVEALSEIDTAGAPLPAAYVVIESERGITEQAGAGLLAGLVTVTFAVAIVVSSAAQRGRVAGDLDRLGIAVRDLLFGWQHPLAERPTEYRGGQLLGVGAGRASALRRFETVYRIRKIA